MTHRRGNWGGRHLPRQISGYRWGPMPSEIPECSCSFCRDLDAALQALTLARWNGTVTAEDRLLVRRLGRQVDQVHGIG